MLERKNKEQDGGVKSGCVELEGEEQHLDSGDGLLSWSFFPTLQWEIGEIPCLKVVIYFLNAYQTQENKLEEIKVRKNKSLTLTKREKKKQQPRSIWLERAIYVLGKVQRRKNPESQPVLYLKLTLSVFKWLFWMIGFIKEVSICLFVLIFSCILRE